MSTWLYPISKKAGRFFDLRGGRKVPVSLDSFKDLVQRGSLKEDRKWYVWQNYRQIQRGDEIYVYTGDKDAGIIGYAIVQGIFQDDYWYVDLKFALDKCRMLVDQPVPAQVVREWIPFPRASVYSLEPFRAKLERYLPWDPNFYLKPTEATFKDLHLKKRSQMKISPREYQRVLVHDTVLEPAADFLRSIGFKVGARNFGNLQVDLVGIKNNHMIITEGKTNKLGQGREAARQAFGQLHEYRWFFRRTSKRKFKYSMWVIFQEQPDKQVTEFLEDSGVFVGWVRNNRVRFTPHSKRKFLEFGLN